MGRAGFRAWACGDGGCAGVEDLCGGQGGKAEGGGLDGFPRYGGYGIYREATRGKGGALPDGEGV